MLFFTAVLIFQRFPIGWTFKKIFLVISSYLFYAAWNPPFVVLLWISTLVDWKIGGWLYRAESGRAKKLLLAASLAVNLGLLAYFKYAGFLIDNVSFLLKALNLEVHLIRPDIILPVGISFYTFQTLSYTLDIYYRKHAPWDSFLDYAMYVAFFPQLVAGPIVRAFDFLPQCRRQPAVTGDQLGWGLSLVTLGLFEKIVLADGLLAPIVETVFHHDASPRFASAWIGTFAFSGQIFCDFAGYSTCAIGTAKCLGFDLPINFRYPYAALGFRDFWKRWHISLSTWFRDYLYIPMGGNRKGPLRNTLNLISTMLIAGLWHGASWNFAIWGGFHGGLLALERMMAKLPVAGSVAGRLNVFKAVATFCSVSVAWVFFRSDSLAGALTMVSTMFGFEGNPENAIQLSRAELITTCAVVGGLICVQWLMRDARLDRVASKIPWWGNAVLLSAMLVLMATTSGEDRAFIYFQF